jgi:hypothetical protein
MQPQVEAALIAAIGAAIGWFANHWLTARRDESRRQVEAQLKFVERQIEELYGPLAAALYKGRRAFQDLLQSLGRNYVFYQDRPLPPEELKTWLFWAESEFLPRNEQVKSLLKSKAHLVVGSSFPDSYVCILLRSLQFLGYSSSPMERRRHRILLAVQDQLAYRIRE